MPLTPALIMVAPTGARRSKADHPALPLTPAEIARTAAACAEAGAGLLHLHVREADGRHSLDPNLYREAVAAVRAEVGTRLIVQITTEAVGRYSAAEQMAAVDALEPEAVSIALAEILSTEAMADPTHETTVAAFFARRQRAGTLLQIILYTPADASRLASYVNRGIIPERCFPLFVLGRYATPQIGNPADLVPFRAAYPAETPWATCCFGETETAASLATLALGGHPRIGFENNLHLADGCLAPANAALVAQLVSAAPLAGRRPMMADEARTLLSG